MSDMINRLSDLATQAGSDAATRLAGADVTAGLATQVHRGVRRRRATASSIAALVAVVAAAAAIVLPRLMEPAPLPPGADVRVPVQTNEGLITYDDGSMQVLNHAGSVVEVPAAAASAPAFAILTKDIACATDPATLKPGWTPQFADAFQLVTFGRPLVLDEAGYHGVTQGERVNVGANYAKTKFAFAVDVDPAVAPYVVLTMTSYWLAADGTVAYYASQFESRPAVEYAGDPALGTYTATLTTRPVEGGNKCQGNGISPDVTSVVRYLTVTAFLNDGHGHVDPIATHSSWITIVKESS